MRHKTVEYKSLSDDHLIAQYLRNHDQEALGELFKRYMHLIFGIALKYLGNQQDAEDLTMRIYEKLMHELPKTSIRNFSGWLHVLTRNECLMKLRKSMKSGLDKKIPLVGTEFVENEESMHLIKENKLLALEKCIEELKEEQKICVKQFFLKSKSYRQIAQELKMEEKNVKSHIQNGKRNLKICIEQSEK